MKRSVMRALFTALLVVALGGVVRADTAPLALRGGMTAGGGTLVAGGYSLVGAIGQPLADSLAAGEYRLAAGLVLPAGAPPEVERRVYLPVVQR